MKKTKLLIPLLMAIVMMAMSPAKAWAEEYPELYEGDNTVDYIAPNSNNSTEFENASQFTTFYKYVAPASGRLTVSASGDGNCVGALFSSDKNTLFVTDTGSNGYGDFKFSYNVTKGEVYLIGLRNFFADSPLTNYTITLDFLLGGTPYDLANYSSTIKVYSDHFESGSTSQPYTENLVFTGNGSKTIWVYGKPANGEIILRDATITVNDLAIHSFVNTELILQGNVQINATSAFYAPTSGVNLDVTGPGNLSVNITSSSAPVIIGNFDKLNLNILGDIVFTAPSILSSGNFNELNINANTITYTGTAVSSNFFFNADKTTLHAKGDILLESVSTQNETDFRLDKIWCFKSIVSDEGTVLMRMGKGGNHESVGVKAGYAGIPAVSAGNTNFSAFTWKIVDKTSGAATYYGCDPRTFSVAYTNSYDVYISLVKDSEGNTVFDMANLNNGPINLYDGHFSNNNFRNICWEGHPVFTGTDNTSRFFIFVENLTAENTPILRDLSISTSGPCLHGNGKNVAAIIDGNVSLINRSGFAINSSSCTITGNGSLVLSGSGLIYSCPDLNIDITGDLLGYNCEGSPLYDHTFDFTKLHANSITFRGHSGSNTEHAIIMPKPLSTPAASDPSITYTVKGDYKDGYTIWCADYKSLIGGFRTDLDGDITILDDSKYTNETALSLSDAADFDISGYTSATFCVPSVSYERTMSASNWGTIMMPFELRSNSNVQYYAVTTVDLSAGTMTATPVNVVYPGHPCLFKRLTGGNLNLDSSKTLVCTDYASQEINNNWDLYGTYTTKNLDATADSKHYYYISADKFWHATGTVSVKPYRAYFTGEAPASSAKALTIVTIDGETTGIEAVMDSEGNIYDASNGIYDLQGRKLSSLQKGINIVNGKKVVVK